MALRIANIGSLSKINTPISKSPKSVKFQGTATIQKNVSKKCDSSPPIKNQQQRIAAAVSPSKSQAKSTPVLLKKANYVYEANIDGSTVQQLLSSEMNGVIIKRNLKNWSCPMKLKSPRIESHETSQKRGLRESTQKRGLREVVQKGSQSSSGKRGLREVPSPSQTKLKGPSHIGGKYEEIFDGSVVQQHLNKDSKGGVIIMRNLNWNTPMKQQLHSKILHSTQIATTQSLSPNKKTKQTISSSPRRSDKCPALTPDECARRVRGESFSENNFNESTIQKKLLVQ